MTIGLMRRSPLTSLPFAFKSEQTHARHPSLHQCLKCIVYTPQTRTQQQSRTLANIRDDRTLSDLWFTSSSPFQHFEPPTFPGGGGGGRNEKPPDERTLKLGKTVRILHERLPTLLASPLPQEALSPQISLHLFPSTHPHLPTVSGRIAYSAALWTAPVAWGRVPVVGNVRLTILSERMLKSGNSNFRSNNSASLGNEKLIVRWKTCGKTKGRGVGALYRGIYGKGDQVDKITEFLGGDASRDDEEFTGLFIFEFDQEGRIVHHTIEHAQQGGNWEKMTRVVNVTDWLLGRAKWKKAEEEAELALGYCEIEPGEGRRKFGRRKDDAE